MDANGTAIFLGLPESRAAARGDRCGPETLALRRESHAFRQEFRPHQRFLGAPCRAWFCGPAWLTVLVLETGIGRARMMRW